MNPKIIDELAALAKDPAMGSRFVQKHLTNITAPLKEKTVFTSMGRTVVHQAGERVLYGANGQVLCRVTQDEMNGSHIEENHSLHVVIRPNVVSTKFHGGMQ